METQATTMQPSVPAGVVVQTPQAATTNLSQPAPIQQFSNSSYGGNNFGSYFRNTNWLEIGFLVLGTTALFCVIYYYRQKTKVGIKDGKKVQQELSELKSDISEIKDTLNSNESNSGGLVL